MTETYTTGDAEYEQAKRTARADLVKLLEPDSGTGLAHIDAMTRPLRSDEPSLYRLLSAIDLLRNDLLAWAKE